jgi:hypothetical protein
MYQGCVTSYIYSRTAGAVRLEKSPSISITSMFQKNAGFRDNLCPLPRYPHGMPSHRPSLGDPCIMFFIPLPDSVLYIWALPLLSF